MNAPLSTYKLSPVRTLFEFLLTGVDGGSSLIETALITPVMVLMLFGSADLGRALNTAITVSSAAHSGAVYGSQNPYDIAGMNTAASLDAADLPTLSTTSKYGCECSDGSSDVPSCVTEPTCSYNVVDYVEVNTTATYSFVFSSLLPSSSIVLHGKTRMRAAHP